MSGVAVRLLLWAATVQVEGSSSCPRPELVATRLAELLPADAGGGPPDRARIWEEGDAIAVELESPDGTSLGARRFPRTYACEDLASALALSLAGWESDVHPEFTPRLAGRGPRPTLIERAPPQPGVTQPWEGGAGVAVGLGGSLDVRAGAVDAVLGGWLTPPAWRTSVRVEVGGQSNREIPLQYGRVVWRRLTAGLGVERPIPTALNHEDRAWLRWFALARLAWLDMRGDGFALNHSDAALDPGLAAGLRVVMRRGHLSSWVELAAAAWPVRHDVQAGGLGDIGRLPVAEGFLRIGLGLTSPR